MRILECQICYEKKRSVIKCFHKCSAIICHCCFKKLIELNKAKKISYQCPVCREVAVRHVNRKFTIYCNKNIDLLKRFVSLLEKQNELNNEQQADQEWAIHMAEYDDYQAMHAERMREHQIQEREAHWDTIDFDSHLPYALPQRLLRSSSI